MQKKYLKRRVKSKIAEYAKIFPIVGILGPRQCGKSTLIKDFIKSVKNAEYFDLENYEDILKISTDPLSFFNTYKNRVICLDEIQRLPQIFQTMRGIIDNNKKNGQFFILGSASPKLIKQSSESLAGRIGYIELTPFDILEISSNNISGLKHWIRGGFPDSYLSKNEEASFIWREAYIKNIVERDIQEFKKVNIITIVKLLQFLSHYHGQILNYHKLSSSFSVGAVTIENYIDILESMYIVRRLKPFFLNNKKRLIKSPKIYIRDSGLLHSIARIHNESELKLHPLLGFSFEGYVLENLITIFSGCEASYFRTSNGEEIDLILQKGGKTAAIEVELSVSPSITKKGMSAIKFIKPNHTFIVVPSYQKVYKTKRDYGNLTIGSLHQIIKEIEKVF